MNVKELLAISTDKDRFKTLADYIGFSQRYLDFIESNLQARIVSQNENQYQFYQYNQDGHYNITRPINTNLMYNSQAFATDIVVFNELLRSLSNDSNQPHHIREVFNKTVYTIQQSIGATLDALAPGKTNQARKLHGDLFERFMRILFHSININCVTGVIKVPVKDINGKKMLDAVFQHDLIIMEEDKMKIIGSVKTSSKDRIDKVFMDKFMYWKLTETCIPHIAVFLNDVQRKKASRPNQYGVNSTFLSGHFKAYAMKLNPLDGVYYCDIRPNMTNDTFLASHISTLDKLFFDDVWKFLSKDEQIPQDIEIKPTHV